MGSTKDAPNVVAFPPLILAAALGAAWLLGYLIPIDLMPEDFSTEIRMMGIGLIAFAVLLGGSGILAFRRAGTNVEPHKPSLVIVDQAPYSFTRNPMYLGLMAVHLGMTLAVPLTWGLVTIIPLALTLHYGVVLREEAYLTAKFDAEYTSYLSRTRRWI